MALVCPRCGRPVEKKGTILNRKYICRNLKCPKHNCQVIPVDTKKKKWR